MAIKQDSDVTRNILQRAHDYFERFKSQREESSNDGIYGVWKWADYADKAGRNRDIYSSEKEKGANLEDDTERAQTGSTLFHRQVSLLASQGAAVTLSDVPFKYKPIMNEGVFFSGEDGDEQAHQYNCLARWTMKQDGFAKKMVDFWYLLRKYGNLPVMIEQKRVVEPRIVKRPVLSPDGNMTIRERTERMIVANHPSLKILPIDSVYADALVGELEDQDCIVVVSVNGMAHFWDGVASEYYDRDAVASIGKTHQWSGMEQKKLLQDRISNQGNDSTPESVTDQYVTYDIFMRAPLVPDKDGKTEWDEDGAWQIRWFTVVGNTISEGVLIRNDDNPDPDEEMPIKMIHDEPDSSDFLYHIAKAQIIRSNYSVQCTLMNQAIDNMTLVNHPPLIEKEGVVSGDDRVFGPHKVWFTEEDIDKSLKQFEVRDSTSQTGALLQYIEADTKRALGTTDMDIGQAAGARTSALEISKLDRNAQTPHMISIRYVLEQLLPWYARKLKSYWDYYAIEEQVVAITDIEKFQEVRPAQLYGDFDVEINIVDEYEQDLVEKRNLQEFIQLVAGNELLARNVDIPELLIAYAKKNKLDYSKFIKPPYEADSHEIAQMENAAIMQQGETVQVRQNENMSVHLAEHRGERLRYKGVEEQYPNVMLLDQHIAETELAIQQGSTPGTVSGPKQSQNQGEGEEYGNQIAAALGAAGGGM